MVFFLTLPLDMNGMYNGQQASRYAYDTALNISDIRRKRNKRRTTYPEIVQRYEQKEKEEEEKNEEKKRKHQQASGR